MSSPLLLAFGVSILNIWTQHSSSSLGSKSAISLQVNMIFKSFHTCCAPKKELQSLQINSLTYHHPSEFHPLSSDAMDVSIHNNFFGHESNVIIKGNLAHLKFPKLSTLRLSQSRRLRGAENAPLLRTCLMEFFSEFSNTLSTLILQDITVKDIDLIAILAQLIHFDALEVIDHNKTPNITENLIHHIFTPQIPESNSIQQSILPCLNHLKIDLAHGSSKHISELNFSLFSRLATSRRATVPGQFQDVNTTRKLQTAFFAIRDLECPQELLETWENLRIGGLNVTVVDSSGVVDFTTSSTCETVLLYLCILAQLTQRFSEHMCMRTLSENTLYLKPPPWIFHVGSD